MRMATKSLGEKIEKDIKRAIRKHYSSEEKIRIMLDGCAARTALLSCVAHCLAVSCRHDPEKVEGISQYIY